MAYTPINWQTGDTITAEKMNKMDNGWGVQSAQLFSETVTTTQSPLSGKITATLAYSSEITDSVINVTLNGTSYNSLQAVESEYGTRYGGVDLDGEIDLSDYPFCLTSNQNGNFLNTSATGEYTITVFANTLVTSENFDNAVRSVEIESTESFEVIIGTTTYNEAYNAFVNGARVYILSVWPAEAFQQQVIYIDRANYALYALARNGYDVELAVYSASSADGVIED